MIAIKKIRIDNIDEGIPSTALREITLIKELNHPNIIKIQDIIYEEGNLEIIFDFVDEDLKQYMIGEGERDKVEKIEKNEKEYIYEKNKKVKVIMYQLIAGIKHCHDN
jgi:serine/threonine protein kinase